MCERTNSYKSVEKSAIENSTNVVKKENMISSQAEPVENMLMDREEILECLEKVRVLRMRYMTKEAELENLKKFDKVNSANITGAPNAKSEKTDLVLNLIIEKETIEKVILNEKIGYLISYLEAKKIISLVDNELHRDIFDRRYLHEQSWEEIIEQIGYSRAHVFREYKKALSKLEKKLKDEIE